MWRSPAAIAAEYGLADRKTVYRHAHALDLFPRRAKNIRAALESILEKSGEVEVSASAVVAAVQAYAKINAAGSWIDRTEMVSMNDLFARMSAQELETYASTGVLPPWFNAFLPATSARSHGVETTMITDRNLSQLATENGVRPGDFALGSAQSRAAARRILQDKMKGLRRRELIIGIDEDRAPNAGNMGKTSAVRAR